MSNEKIISSVDTVNMGIKKVVSNKNELISIDNIGQTELKIGDEIGIDLTCIRSIGSLEMLGFFNEADFVIEVSLDGLTWDEITVGSSFDVNENVFGRYIRIRALRNTEVELYEIEIYIDGSFSIEEVMEKVEMLEYISKVFSKEENSDLGLENLYQEYLDVDGREKIERWKWIRGRCNMN